MGVAQGTTSAQARIPDSLATRTGGRLRRSRAAQVVGRLALHLQGSMNRGCRGEDRGSLIYNETS
jgi:hypothetical protein